MTRIGASAVDPTSVTGNGVSWTKKTAVSDGSGVMRIHLYVADSGSSPSSGALTVSYGAVTQLGQHVSVFELSGVDLSGGATVAVVQAPTTTGTAAAGSITLAAAGQMTNRPISGWAHAANEATNERANWVEVHDGSFATPVSGKETQWRPDFFETTSTASWTTSSIYVGIAAEVKALIGPFTTDQADIDLCEATTNWAFLGTTASSGVDNDQFREGANCVATSCAT